MPQELLNKCLEEMEKAKSAFEKDMASIRTGRASTALLDNIKVDVYGSFMNLASLGSIAVSDAKTLLVTVWDMNNINLVDSAIRSSDLGLNPKIDGNKLFISLPDLTQERRKEFIKIVKKKGEEMKIRIRNIRRDTNENYKKLEKDKSISEDDLKQYLLDIQKKTDEYTNMVEQMLKNKEKDLLAL